MQPGLRAFRQSKKTGRLVPGLDLDGKTMIDIGCAGITLIIGQSKLFQVNLINLYNYYSNLGLQTEILPVQEQSASQSLA